MAQQIPPRFQAKYLYEFGPYRLDPNECQLLRDGEVLPLTPKAFEILSLLIENCGHILQKEEIMQTIWPDSFVEEATLAQNIFVLRRVLGESPNQAQFIETVPRRGYRFIASVSRVAVGEEQSATAAAATQPPTSIAVLPFIMLTDGSDNEYFGVGITDALITRLSNIKDITVRPTGSILKFQSRDRNLELIGRELKVQWLLDGIIQRLDDRIRVTVQLVNTEAGGPVWADKFDQMFQDVFALQDHISDQVIEALTLKLSADEQLQLQKRQPRSSEAFRLYLKGRYLWSKWSEEGFKRSIPLFDQAIEIDPNYAQAYVGCANAYTSLCFYGHMSPQEAMPQAKTMAQIALRLDESLVDARISLASSLFMYDWDWAGAEKEFKVCIKQNPNNANAYQTYGLYLIALKRFEEATSQLNRALEADPVSPLVRVTAGFPYHYSGDTERALRQYRETLEEEPYFGLAHVALSEIYVLEGKHEEALYHYQQASLSWGEKFTLPYIGYAYAVSGKRREAIACLKKLQALSQHEYISPLSIAMVHLGLGEIDETFAWLEKARQGRCNKLVFLNVQPIFSPLRADPRFDHLLAAIGLRA